MSMSQSQITVKVINNKSKSATPCIITVTFTITLWRQIMCDTRFLPMITSSNPSMIEKWCSYNVAAGSFHTRNFVADFFRQKLNFTGKTAKCHPLGDLGVMYTVNLWLIGKVKMTVSRQLLCQQVTDSVQPDAGVCMHILVAVWRSGSVVGRINEVALHSAQLVLRWVTMSGFDSQRRHFI